ncbi:MAG: prepilin-type N-terminal cleavage/methylation domain-containing protein, partial [Planctomycetaceae bacterium]
MKRRAFTLIELLVVIAI